MANCWGGVMKPYGAWYWNSTVSGAARPVPPMRNSDRALTARSASVSVLTPESFVYGVHPTPAMAARSRSGWATSDAIHAGGVAAEHEVAVGVGQLLRQSLDVAARVGPQRDAVRIVGREHA